MQRHYHNMYRIILVILIKYTKDDSTVGTRHISFMIEKSFKVKLK